ncbi:DNA-binding protein YbaB [Nocardia sp. GAS34]|uniref:YbaB/EbfC family nucleoid-associated protein n=1 Tax=unclassified Nocardia TaxID=2637762 RepID=UPI003D23C03E
MTTDDFAAFEESAQARLDRMQQLSDDLAALEIRHTGVGGAVTVVVDGSARLLDIVLSVDISRLSPAEFGRAVIDTAAAATHRALARRGALISEFNEQVNS